MAYIDNEVITPVELRLAGESEEALKDFLKSLLWKLFEKYKHESYKGKLWGIIPYSIKVEKIEPILVTWLGPNPYVG